MNLDRIIEVTRAVPTKRPGEYLGYCPSHDDQHASLSIAIKGGKPLVYCFANCTQNDVVDALKTKGAWPSAEKGYVGFVSEKAEDTSDVQKLREATDIYDKAESNPNMVAKYFTQRGIVGASEELFKDIKFHEGKSSLVFPLRDLSGKNGITGVQEIKIDSSGNNVKSSSGANVKLCHGSISGSGFIWGDITNATVIAITEGIETGLAVHMATGLPTVALIGTSGLRSDKNNFPSQIGTFYVFEDKDVSEAGRKAAQSFSQNQSGKIVYVCTPPLEIPKGQKGIDFLDAYKIDPDLIRQSMQSAVLQNWEKPIPWKISLPKPPKLESSDLPEALYDFISAESQAMNTKIDYFLPPIIVALSTLVSRVYLVQPNQKDDRYLESPNLYGAIVAPPGVKKSAIFRRSCQEFLNMVDEDNCRADSENQIKVNKLIAERNELQGKLKKIEKGKEADQNFKKLGSELAKIEQEISFNSKSLNAICLNHTTDAALITRASKTNKTLAIFRDELTGLFSNFKDKHSQGLRQLILEGWNGQDNFIKETKIDGREEIKLLSLTLLGGIQPSKIRPILAEIKNGMNDDGLVYRIQALVYPELTKEPKYECLVDHKCIVRVKNIFWRLNCMGIGILQRKKITFTSDAQKIYENFRDWVDSAPYDAKFDDLSRGYIAKLPTLFCSLALIFQVVDDYEKLGDTYNLHISELSATRALKTTHYFLGHIQRMIYMEVNREISLASFVVSKIKEGKIKTGMTIRDVYRHEWSGLKDPKDVVKGLQALANMHWLKIEEVKSEFGGPAKEQIIINPLITVEGVDSFTDDTH